MTCRPFSIITIIAGIITITTGTTTITTDAIMCRNTTALPYTRLRLSCLISAGAITTTIITATTDRQDLCNVLKRGRPRHRAAFTFV